MRSSRAPPVRRRCTEMRSGGKSHAKPSSSQTSELAVMSAENIALTRAAVNSAATRTDSPRSLSSGALTERAIATTPAISARTAGQARAARAPPRPPGPGCADRPRAARRPQNPRCRCPTTASTRRGSKPAPTAQCGRWGQAAGSADDHRRRAVHRVAGTICEAIATLTTIAPDHQPSARGPAAGKDSSTASPATRPTTGPRPPEARKATVSSGAAARATMRRPVRPDNSRRAR